MPRRTKKNITSAPSAAASVAGTEPTSTLLPASALAAAGTDPKPPSSTALNTAVDSNPLTSSAADDHAAAAAAAADPTSEDADHGSDGHSDGHSDGDDHLKLEDNVASDMITANCGEFDKQQWLLVAKDHSNRDIAQAMRRQGEMRYMSASDADKPVALPSQQQLFELSLLYIQHQRPAIVERLERGYHAARRERIKALSAMLPIVEPPEPIEMTFKVTCQVGTAKPKTKPVKAKREKGLSLLVAAAVKAHPGLAVKKTYSLSYVNSAGTETLVTDATIMELCNNMELKLVQCTDIQAASTSAAAATSAAAKQAPEKILELRTETSIGHLLEDVARFVVPLPSQTIMLRYPKLSLLSYMVYWAGYTLNSLHHRLVDGSGMPVVMEEKAVLNCLMSLQRAILELTPWCPAVLVEDARLLEELLKAKLTERGIDQLAKVADHYPELINQTSYDLCTPKTNQLYAEQAEVLDILHEKIGKDERCLIGYRVPPSGGKTILSVAIAAMIGKYHSGGAAIAARRRPKRLLYVCYNTLVRMSVANACDQADIPFWVASTKKATKFAEQHRDGKLSVVAPSWSCQDRSRHALRRQPLRAERIGMMVDMWARAQEMTVHHNPVVIADVSSALLLLDLFPEDFVLYFDEPSAGAENGVVDNEMQVAVALLMKKLPHIRQAVLLSATLPDLMTEIPALFSEGIVVKEDIVCVNTQRLPVGSVAIAPDGRQVLPHQLPSDWVGFQEAVRGLQNDALMLRFYTPGPVRQIAQVVRTAVGAQLPSDLVFERVIATIGELSHKTIRDYAQRLLLWVSQLDQTAGEPVFHALSAIVHGQDAREVKGETFIADHVWADSEGYALAVTTESELGDLVTSAMSPYASRIPDAKAFVERYLMEKELYDRQVASFMRAGNIDAIADLDEPKFLWPVKIADKSAWLEDKELRTLIDEESDLAALLFSGLGVYKPSEQTSFERSLVMREAAQGHLACLFSTPDIVYGTNMSLKTVLIGEGYGKKGTRNSLYQLIGRAGRTGKSHRAKILFQDNATMRKALLPEPPGRNFEAEVMNWHLLH